MLETKSLDALGDALDALEREFAELPDCEAPDAPRIQEVLGEVAARLGDNFPYFHPLYAGQMLKPPHPVARAAYALATWINPNNHALDGGRASTGMEREAVAQIAAMFGWQTHLGHLTGGGTMANLEALWVAGCIDPGKTVAASAQAHYTHQRISSVLRLPFAKVPTDARGRMDARALEAMLAEGDIGCVVATLGTTATGSVDPLGEILALRRRYGFRLHVDAAYGGYFALADNLAPDVRAAFDLAGEADSLVIDPHKHGLQPYGCGCVLFRDPAVGTLYKHDSPATYFSSRELHLGEISLECSRPGASAVALWATMRLLPLVRGGEFARGLSAGRRAALALHARLSRDPRFVAPFPPDLDIVVWAPKSGSAEDIFREAARRNLHLAMARLPGAFFGDPRPEVVCLRSVLMKPEHEQWIDRIWEILDAAAGHQGAAEESQAVQE
ncbi:MAG TPA: aminotransferase class I/II-fold pyridoxal phosphate-dependent enzyme [Bryobacteraceae bacterium]|nr:aminotransferase class I/II-fold pyridoxal phosphate-dependent enzyme [Bryobacteraceae bacterium]